MNRINKLFEKFLDYPERYKYKKIEKLLLKLGFEVVPARGSHRKITHREIKGDLIIPVHRGDCKGHYKRQIAITIINNNIYEK